MTTETKEEIAPELEAQALDEARSVDPGRTSMLAALEYRDFRYFWFGLIVSNIGSWMQIYGLGWLVVELAIRDGTPNLGPFYLGLTGLARAIPGLLFGLFGGVVADRADRRRLLIVTQSSAAVTAGILAALTIADRINIVDIVLLSALNSIIFSFDAPTRNAMVPRLVHEGQLMSAIGLNSAAFNGATLIGPLIGGVLIIPFGVGGLMLINAISYLAVVGALLVIESQPVLDTRRGSMLGSIRDGVRYIRREPVLRWVIGLSIATALLTRPYVQLLPAEAQFLSAGPVDLSFLLAATGVGALGGALTTAALGGWRRRGIVLVASALAHGVLLSLFGVQHTLVGAIVFVALTSFAVMVFLGMANTLIQTRTPDYMRGRAMSVYTMVMIGGIPLGQMMLGTFGTFFGINTAFLIGGILVAIVSLYALTRVPPLRDALDVPRPRVVAGSE